MNEVVEVKHEKKCIDKIRKKNIQIKSLRKIKIEKLCVKMTFTNRNESGTKVECIKNLYKTGKNEVFEIL